MDRCGHRRIYMYLDRSVCILRDIDRYVEVARDIDGYIFVEIIQLWLLISTMVL